ncbi:MAG: prephenate dehydrogenase [Actinomycetota bacterium]|nr:prephenate dehydrogenase [Actinomycetota bacterium]
MKAVFEKVAIVGLGLMGGSLGLAIKALKGPPKVVGIARRSGVIAEALKMGAIDAGTTDVAEGVKGADLIFLALPVGAMAEKVKEMIPHLKEGAIITDVGSTKESVTQSIQEILPKSYHFIGGHPMCGSEKDGISAASESLFKNAYYILTPTKETSAPAFKRLHSLLTAISAKVIAIEPKKHDHLVAAISHLPHLLSAALVNLAKKGEEKEESLLLLAAGGFRDTTRIAAGNPDMWVDICLENDKAILSQIEGFERELGKFASAIRAKDKEALRKALHEAQVARKNLPIVTLKDIRALKELTISVTDRPGAISDITVSIGNIGINIEDITLVHLSEESGLVKLVVADEDSAKRAAKVLKKKGYVVQISGLYEREER